MSGADSCNGGSETRSRTEAGGRSIGTREVDGAVQGLELVVFRVRTANRGY